jgi:hypothetical protein
MLDHKIKCTFNAENKSYSDKHEEMTKKVDELIDIAIFIKNDLDVPGSPFGSNPLARKGDKAQELGIVIAHYFRWQGKDLIKTFSSALEDSNYHTFNQKMIDLWEIEYGGFAEKKVKLTRDEFKKIADDYKNTTPGKERVLILDDESRTVSQRVEFIDEE